MFDLWTKLVCERDLLAALLGRAARDAFVRVVVAPIGFLADHLEILYDLDIEARESARTMGLDFSRTESLNDSEDFLDVLEGLIRPHAT